MIRNLVSVVIGFVVWSVLWVASQQVIGQLMPETVREDGSVDSTGVLLAMIFLSFVYSIISGFTTAALARGNRMKPALFLGVILLIVGIYVQSMYWSVIPVWYHLVFLGLLIPGVLIGARMRAGKTG